MALGLAVWLAIEATDDARGVVLLTGLAGAALTAAAPVWPVVLGPALLASGGAYAALLVIDQPPLDTRAVGVAVTLVVVGELVGWARELASTTRDEPGGAWRRPAWIAGVAAVALGAAWALLALVDVIRVEGLAVEAVGALAALSALALVGLVATDRDASE